MYSSIKHKIKQFSKYLSIFSFVSLFFVKKSQAVITLTKISGVPTKPIADILDDIIKWILGFGLMIAVTFLVWGGINYVASSGDATKTENAKKVVKYSILGVLVIGFSYAAIIMLDVIFS
ncbi:hypothetical protein KAT63_03095 [Candidatus Parcubacteria bacterium]|nr:hypothetical protein [Candidatus Parcubacteria bacterium]